MNLTGTLGLLTILQFSVVLLTPVGCFPNFRDAQRSWPRLPSSDESELLDYGSPVNYTPTDFLNLPCHCEYLSHLSSPSHCFSVQDKRHIAYLPEKNECYKLLDQGPCETDEWLVLNSNSEPICESRICPPSTTSGFSFYDRTTNQCYSVGGLCPANGNDEGQVWKVDHFDWIPKCGIHRDDRQIKSPKVSFRSSVGHMIGFRCPPGTREFMGRCRKSGRFFMG